jgi:molybdopterin-guanine dinucleotide biosynthesis protein A
MGHDKADLVVGSERLGERTAALLRQVAGLVLEVGPGYTSLARTAEEPPGSGPLAALAAGAEALRARHRRGPVLVVATDLPRLTSGYLRMLADHATPSDDHCVVPRDPSGRPQPLCARYSPLALARARALVADGQRSMMALLAEVPIEWLDDTEGVLLDVDTPEDLASTPVVDR